ALLSEAEFRALAEAFELSPQGNFEGKIHFNLKAFAYWEKKYSSPLQVALKKLKAFRQKRIPPHLDDKILTAWNGLMIRAMALAARVLKDDQYLQAARAASGFLEKHLIKKEGLLARYREGEARFAARLEDYAFWIQALIELYQKDWDKSYLDLAQKLQAEQDEKFWDKQEGGYFLTQQVSKDLIYRSKEVLDGALPSASGVAAHNLLRLQVYTGESSYQQKLSLLFKSIVPSLASYPQAMATWLIALNGMKESHACRPGELCLI
ncbi:MAG: thioredoxin domain-containing protein, partial [Deltaproteobacteria bacterium]|nr:thioredoxin domain-containing protein [Deltaproteobacteria bacterium]